MTAHATHSLIGTPERCPSCGADVASRFCCECGEERASERHYSLRHIGEELIETFTHADGRALRTVWTLLSRPGDLTSAYMRGARKPYLAPLQLFFLVNVVYFLFTAVTHTNTFGTPLEFHVQGNFYSGVAARMVAHRLAVRHVTYTAYAAQFDHAAMLQAKSLIILMVPLLALVAALVTIPRSREPVRHVVFALHTMPIILIAVMVVGVVVGLAIAAYARSAGTHVEWQTTDKISTLVMLVAIGAYVDIAIRRVYLFAARSALLRAVAFTVLFVPAIFLYRAVLFFTTFWGT